MKKYIILFILITTTINTFESTLVTLSNNLQALTKTIANTQKLITWLEKNNHLRDQEAAHDIYQIKVPIQYRNDCSKQSVRNMLYIFDLLHAQQNNYTNIYSRINSDYEAYFNSINKLYPYEENSCVPFDTLTEEIQKNTLRGLPKDSTLYLNSIISLRFTDLTPYDKIYTEQKAKISEALAYLTSVHTVRISQELHDVLHFFALDQHNILESLAKIIEKNVPYIGIQMNVVLDKNDQHAVAAVFTLENNTLFTLFADSMNLSFKENIYKPYIDILRTYFNGIVTKTFTATDVITHHYCLEMLSTIVLHKPNVDPETLQQLASAYIDIIRPYAASNIFQKIYKPIFIKEFQKFPTNYQNLLQKELDKL